ncbi:MAG: hypothetical protein HKO71_03445 [Pseudomonadales bacterium]|nr:hypothetical protein [Gammaproteobacteria bacterium]NNL56780.1 hypothetical protein [Pseudomonadales bacterium]
MDSSKNSHDSAANVDATLLAQLDELIKAYSEALQGGDWARLGELDRSMKDAVERAMRPGQSNAVPAEIQHRLKALAELNQRALSLASAERDKVADQLQDLANAKAGAAAYAKNAKL